MGGPIAYSQGKGGAAGRLPPRFPVPDCRFPTVRLSQRLWRVAAPYGMASSELRATGGRRSSMTMQGR